MDNELETITDTPISRAFQDSPKELIDFMGSKTFDILLNGIQQVLTLTDEQKESARYAAYYLLLNMKSIDLVFEELVDSGMDEELAAKVLYAIGTQILNRAADIIDYYTEEDDIQAEGLSSDAVKNAPTPDEVLASLEERLTKSRVVTPVTREYGSITPSQPKRSIDPYRELPED